MGNSENGYKAWREQARQYALKDPLVAPLIMLSRELRIDRVIHAARAAAEAWTYEDNHPLGDE